MTQAPKLKSAYSNLFLILIAVGFLSLFSSGTVHAAQGSFNFTYSHINFTLNATQYGSVSTGWFTSADHGFNVYLAMAGSYPSTFAWYDDASYPCTQYVIASSPLDNTQGSFYSESGFLLAHGLNECNLFATQNSATGGGNARQVLGILNQTRVMNFTSNVSVTQGSTLLYKFNVTENNTVVILEVNTYENANITWTTGGNLNCISYAQTYQGESYYIGDFICQVNKTTLVSNAPVLTLNWGGTTNVITPLLTAYAIAPAPPRPLPSFNFESALSYLCPYYNGQTTVLKRVNQSLPPSALFISRPGDLIQNLIWSAPIKTYVSGATVQEYQGTTLPGFPNTALPSWGSNGLMAIFGLGSLTYNNQGLQQISLANQSFAGLPPDLQFLEPGTIVNATVHSGAYICNALASVLGSPSAGTYCATGGSPYTAYTTSRPLLFVGVENLSKYAYLTGSSSFAAMTIYGTSMYGTNYTASVPLSDMFISGLLPNNPVEAGGSFLPEVYKIQSTNGTQYATQNISTGFFIGMPITFYPKSASLINLTSFNVSYFSVGGRIRWTQVNYQAIPNKTLTWVQLKNVTKVLGLGVFNNQEYLELNVSQRLRLEINSSKVPTNESIVSSVGLDPVNATMSFTFNSVFYRANLTKSINGTWVLVNMTVGNMYSPSSQVMNFSYNGTALLDGRPTTDMLWSPNSIQTFTNRYQITLDLIQGTQVVGATPYNSLSIFERIFTNGTKINYSSGSFPSQSGSLVKFKVFYYVNSWNVTPTLTYQTPTYNPCTNTLENTFPVNLQWNGTALDSVVIGSGNYTINNTSSSQTISTASGGSSVGFWTPVTTPLGLSFANIGAYSWLLTPQMFLYYIIIALAVAIEMYIKKDTHKLTEIVTGLIMSIGVVVGLVSVFIYVPFVIIIAFMLVSTMRAGVESRGG